MSQKVLLYLKAISLLPQQNVSRNNWHFLIKMIITKWFCDEQTFCCQIFFKWCKLWWKLPKLILDNYMFIKLLSGKILKSHIGPNGKLCPDLNSLPLVSFHNHKTRAPIRQCSLRMGGFVPLSFLAVLTANSIAIIPSVHRLAMPGFELQTSDVGSDPSASCATTIGLNLNCLKIHLKITSFLPQSNR